jgi:hypothetical protein
MNHSWSLLMFTKPRPTIELDRPIRRSAHVVSTVQGEEAVILDVKRGQYYALNEVGSRIWELLAKGAKVDALVQALQVEYELPTERSSQTRYDVEQLIKALHAAGLVEVSPDLARH